VELTESEPLEVAKLVQEKRASLQPAQGLVLVMQSWVPEFYHTVADSDLSDSDLATDAAEHIRSVSNGIAQSSTEPLTQEVIIFHNPEEVPERWKDSLNLMPKEVAMAAGSGETHGGSHGKRQSKYFQLENGSVAAPAISMAWSQQEWADQLFYD
jgi:hypothetical protein